MIMHAWGYAHLVKKLGRKLIEGHCFVAMQLHVGSDKSCVAKIGLKNQDRDSL